MTVEADVLLLPTQVLGGCWDHLDAAVATVMAEADTADVAVAVVVEAAAEVDVEAVVHNETHVP